MKLKHLNEKVSIMIESLDIDKENIKSAITEISDELANNFLKGRVEDAVKHNYDPEYASKEKDAIIALIKRKQRQGKELTKDEREFISKNESKEDNTISIYLMNLGKYTEGDIVGRWVQLPVEDWKPVLDSIGINKQYEEWIIADSDAPFKIEEHDDIFELNEIAQEIKDFDEQQLIAFDVLLNDEHEHKDTSLERARNRDFFYIDATNPHDLGLEYVKELGMESVSDMTDYFDYEQYGYSLLANSVYEETYDEDNNFTGFQLSNTDMVLDPSIATEKDLGEYHVEEIDGGVDNLSDADLEFYFDYEKLGDMLEYNFTKTKNGYIQV